MRLIVCEDCGKHYDYDKDEFCTKCGAFNQPVKTWTTDSQGNVRRVDGINEVNHAGSFAHSEVHKEKRVRQAKGMDWNSKNGKAPAQPRRQPPPRPAPQRSQPPAKKETSMSLLKAFILIIGLIITASFLGPLIMMILNFGI